jgi:hypothetical protein
MQDIYAEILKDLCNRLRLKGISVEIPHHDSRAFTAYDSVNHACDIDIRDDQIHVSVPESTNSRIIRLSDPTYVDQIVDLIRGNRELQ